VTPDALAPIFFLSAGLLAAAGAAKLVRPRSTAQALLDVGWPASDAIARVVGTVEVVVGVSALAFGGAAWSAASALVYLAFAAFLAFVLRRHPGAGSCGCAGAKAVPPSRLHLALNLVASASGLAFATADGPGAAVWIADLGAAAIVVIPGLVLAGWLTVIAVTEAPEAWRAWMPPAPHEGHAHEPRDHHTRAEEALASAGIGPGHPSLWPGVEPPSQDGIA
jgi:hypothetical protein